MTARSGSLYWLGLVTSRKIGNPIDKLLLFALADHVDHDDTTRASIALLADEAEISEKAARNHLKDMEARGWIDRAREGRSDGTLGVYVTTLQRDPLEALPAARRAGGPAARGAGGRAARGGTSIGTSIGTTSGTTSGTLGTAPEPPNGEPPNAGPPNVEPPNDEPNTASTSSSGPHDEPEPPSIDDQARSLIAEWWEERKAADNPVGQPYIACLKVVTSMLKNHVPATRIAFGLRHAPVVSTGALELAIQREVQRRSGTGPPAGSARERGAAIMDNALREALEAQQ